MRTFRWVAAVLLSAAGAAWAQSYTWTEITPPGGKVSSVGTHPLDGRIIVLGSFTAQGSPIQVMYSSDHGKTWNASSISQPDASSLFVHPGRPGVVYLTVQGYQGSVRFGTTSTKGSLYRSDDFGRTWSSVFIAGDGESIRVIAADPLDAHGAYALRIPGQACAAFLGCIYLADWVVAYTRIDGVGWTSVSTLLAERFAYYSSPSGPTPTNPTRLFITAGGRALESRDSGATWAPFGATMPAQLEAVVVDPVRANVLYGYLHYIENSSTNRNITLRSDDAGVSWREIFNSQSVAGPPVVDPLRTRTLWFAYPQYVNGSGYLLYRSDDAGETWQTVPYPGHFDIEPFAPGGLFPSTAEPGVVYVINSGRLFRGAPSLVRDPVVAEYQYEGNRYWLTSLEGEAFSQDYRQQPGDVKRTGIKWGAWRADDAPAGAVGSCRFWPRPETGLRTRVLVLQGFECDVLKRDPGWILEAENEFYAMPPVNGACANGLIPVRRFNNLQPDLNHRWVVDDGTEARMSERGWYHEGVRMCSRPLRSDEQ